MCDSVVGWHLCNPLKVAEYQEMEKVAEYRTTTEEVTNHDEEIYANSDQYYMDL